MPKLTLRTSLRRIARVNKHDRNTIKGCLVGDELLEQAIRPTRLLVALSLPHLSRCPLPRTIEVFKGDAEGECLCVGDDALGNRVGHRPDEISLPATDSGKGTTDTPCVLAQPTIDGFLSLKGATKFLQVLPLSENFLTAINVSEAVNGNVGDADINAKPASRSRRSIFRDIGSDGDEEGVQVFSVNQLGMPTTEGEFNGEVLTEDDGHDDAPLDGGDGNSVNAFEGEQALVKVNGGEIGELDGLLKSRFLGQGFVGVADTGDDSDGILGGQGKSFFEFPVDFLLEGDFVNGALLLDDGREPVGGGVNRLQGLKQYRSLLWCRKKFPCQSNEHVQAPSMITPSKEGGVKIGGTLLSAKADSLLPPVPCDGNDAEGNPCHLWAF